MAAETFQAKSYPLRILSVAFLLGALFSPFLLHAAWWAYLLSVLWIVAAFMLWKVPPPRIEVDELGIRRLQQGGIGQDLPHWLLHPEKRCEWKRIVSVSTTRMDDGAFRTVLSVSKESGSQSEGSLAIESSLFGDYAAILQAIKLRATAASFDEMTDSILSGKMDLRPVRPLFWWLIAIVALGVLLLAVYRTG